MPTKTDLITFRESKNKTQDIIYTDIDANATKEINKLSVQDLKLKRRDRETYMVTFVLRLNTTKVTIYI